MINQPKVEVGTYIKVFFGIKGNRDVRVTRIAKSGRVYVQRAAKWGGYHKERPVYWARRLGRWTIDKRWAEGGEFDGSTY